MDDLEFRRRVLSGDTRSTEVKAAAADDPERQRWLNQASALDAVLRKRLHHPPPSRTGRTPETDPDSTEAAQTSCSGDRCERISDRWRCQLSTATQNNSLSSELIQHVAAETNSLYTRQPLSPVTVQLVAGRLGYRFDPPQTNISYAVNCLVLGRQVVHLTVQTSNSSATLLLMPDEVMDRPLQFHQHHLHGRIVPLGRGSAAILSNDPTLLDQLEATTLQQLIF